MRARIPAGQPNRERVQLLVPFPLGVVSVKEEQLSSQPASTNFVLDS